MLKGNKTKFYMYINNSFDTSYTSDDIFYIDGTDYMGYIGVNRIANDP